MSPPPTGTLNPVHGAEVAHQNKPSTVKNTNDDDPTSEIILQRRLQRKKLKRYESDDDSSGDDRSESRKEQALFLRGRGGMKDDHNALSSNRGGRKTKPSGSVPSSPNRVKWSNKAVNATDAITEVANQNLNGELSLLQSYEHRGEMNEVFGSQSVLSQELQQGNFSQQSLRFPPDFSSQTMNTSIVRGTSQILEDDENNDDNNHDSDNGKKPRKDADHDNQVKSEDEEEELSSSNPQSSVSTAKLVSNDEASFSQQSFIVNSLPPLSVSESQLIQDTLPNQTLSQVSIQSGYDMIIGAAQALEQEQEGNYNDGNAGANTDPIPVVKKGDNQTTLIPSTPSLPSVKVDLEEEIAVSSTQHHDMPSLPGQDSKKRVNPDLKNDSMQGTSPQKRQRQNPTIESPISTSNKLSDPTAGIIHTNGTSYAVRRTKAQRRKLEEETNYIAKRAAELVEKLRDNRKVEKQLLLSMALTRENPRSAPSSYPAKGTIIVNGFYWGQFPPLEKVLRSHMEEYYELSIEKCQSRTQQAFNNKLVILVKSEATKYGWVFDEDVFDEKKIRDRIRCFFKTHIQNAKKRLKTMVRNPLKRANAKALANHLDLIEKCELIDKIHTDNNIKEGEVNLKNEGSMPSVDNTMPSLPAETARGSIDSDAHDAAQVLALGFGRLSQDDTVMQTQC